MTITRLIAEAVPVPVIASGGAGTIRHVYDAFAVAGADAALIASMTHLDGHTCGDIKTGLRAMGMPMR